MLNLIASHLIVLVLFSAVVCWISTSLLLLSHTTLHSVAVVDTLLIEDLVVVFIVLVCSIGLELLLLL